MTVLYKVMPLDCGLNPRPLDGNQITSLTAPIAQVSERALRVREVAGSILGRAILKAIKLVRLVSVKEICYVAVIALHSYCRLFKISDVK